MKTFCAIVVLLVSSACYAQQKDPFIGLDRKAIIAQYGRPTVVEKQGNRGEVLIYKRDFYSGTKLRCVPHFKPAHRVGHLSAQTFSFRIDSQGKVGAWQVVPGKDTGQGIMAN